MDELTKTKYNNLLYSLYTIKNKMIELNNKYPNLITKQKNSLVIDNHIVNEETLNNINSDNYKIVNQINNIVIPSVKNKI